jgi:acetyl esterase/lipase
VVIHGGGFIAGDKSDSLVRQVCSFLSSSGYAALAINYRLARPPRAADVPWPRNLQDCKAAVKWLRVNATQFSLNPDRIGALGMSAGGTLAAMLAVTGDSRELEPASPFAGVSSAIQAVVLFYPAMGHEGSGKYSPGFGRQPPATFFKRGQPPFLILQGRYDTGVRPEDSARVAAELSAAGVENRLVMVDGGHGFGLPDGSPLRPIVREFLDQHLLPNS